MINQISNSQVWSQPANLNLGSLNNTISNRHQPYSSMNDCLTSCLPGNNYSNMLNTQNMMNRMMGMLQQMMGMIEKLMDSLLSQLGFGGSRSSGGLIDNNLGRLIDPGFMQPCSTQETGRSSSGIVSNLFNSFGGIGDMFGSVFGSSKESSGKSGGFLGGVGSFLKDTVGSFLGSIF